MNDVVGLTPGYVLCPLPPPVPNASYTHDECGGDFFTDETGEFWMYRWCKLHGKSDDCPDALKRVYSIGEYQRLVALPIQEVKYKEH